MLHKSLLHKKLVLLVQYAKQIKGEKTAKRIEAGKYGNVIKFRKNETLKKRKQA